MQVIVQGLKSLDLLETIVLGFCKDLYAIVVAPRLGTREGKGIHALQFSEDEIQVLETSPNEGLESVIFDLNHIIDFLRQRLLSSMIPTISKTLMKDMVSTLIHYWLASAIPVNVEAANSFQRSIILIRQFAKDLETRGWQGKKELLLWADSVPRVWLNKRQNASLDRVRSILKKGLGDIETVERTETQVISDEDTVLAGQIGHDDWNAEWSDNEGESSPKAQTGHDAADDQEEDVSAWGLDDEADGAIDTKDGSDTNAEEAEPDAWGWGDDTEGNTDPPPPQRERRNLNEAQINGQPKNAIGDQREVTLKETFNITALPREILEIISADISDAKALINAQYVPSFAYMISLTVANRSAMAPAAVGLLALPSLTLSMFRACSPNLYSLNPSGFMFLYNDCSWMANGLRRIANDHRDLVAGNNRPPDKQKFTLEADIAALDAFGKRAYGKEMETQRTVIKDLLDGAQGFADCTQPPFAHECDIAISSTVDRLREIHKQWHGILSHSALLQSISSLLSTVVGKIIVDVEDMSDISEPESQRLTSFCNRISTLEDLFIPPAATPQGTDHQPISLPDFYPPNWPKFQHLTNILDSSLVDIKHLWTDGELRPDFSAEELVDLIEALFADSEHRRKATGEIRRSSGGW